MKDNANNQLRILFISRAFPPVIGGIEKQNFEIYKHLGEIADVTLIANRNGKHFLPFFLPYAILYTLLQARRYEVILLGDGVLAVVSWALRLIRQCPLVCCIVHGLDITFPNKLYQRWWVRCFLRKVDVLFPVSRQTALEAITRGFSEDRCQVIPNGVNTDEFITEFDSKKHISLCSVSNENRHIILTVGRLIERKGVHWFVEYVLPQLNDDIVYVVAGDGPMRKTIEEIIARKGLDSRVHLLGRVSGADLRTLYAAAEIFVQPNITVEGDMEGFGLVVLEAGAAGVPVIASRLEGLIDAISEGENGQLLTPGHAAEYIEQIHALIRDPDLRKAKGQRAYEYVRKHYPWNAVAKRYLKAINTCLHANNR